MADRSVAQPKSPVDGDAKTPTPKRKRPSKLKIFLLVNIPLILLAGIAEIVLRIKCPYITGVTARIIWDDPAKMQSDGSEWPVMYPKHGSGRLVGIEFDVPIKCNADGFRGDDFDDTRSPIVLCLGDSITVGYCIRQEEAFPSLLQDSLRKRWPNLQVWNAGREGASPVTEMRVLDRIFKRYPKADIRAVVLMANLTKQHGAGNDLLDMAGQMPYLLDGTPPDARIPPPAFGGLTDIVRNVAVLHAGEIMIARWRRETLRHKLPPEYEQRWLEYYQCMDRAVELCGKRGTKFIIGLCNTAPSEPLEAIDEMLARLRKHMNPLGVPVIDCSAQHSDLRGKLWFFPVDGHPNALGHKLFAERIEPSIVDVLSKPKQ